MKRFAFLFAVLMTLFITSQTSAKVVKFESGPTGSSARITEYDAHALTLEINENKGTIVFYEPEDDKDNKNHRILFFAERFPKGITDFGHEKYKWSSKLDTCADANPNGNNLIKRVFRVSELDGKGKQIRTFENKLECLLYAHLTVEKGKRKVNIIPVTLNMIGRFLKDGDINSWLINSLDIPQDEASLVPRDHFLTRGYPPQTKEDEPDSKEANKPYTGDIINATIQDEAVKIVYFRDDSVDYFNPTEDKLDSAGLTAATVEHGTSGTTKALLILAITLGLFYALLRLFMSYNMRRGAAKEAATPGWLGKSCISIGSLVTATIITYHFSPLASLAMVGAGCLIMVLASTFVKPDTESQQQFNS